MITIESESRASRSATSPIPVGATTPGHVNIVADEGAVALSLSPLAARSPRR